MARKARRTEPTPTQRRRAMLARHEAIQNRIAHLRRQLRELELDQRIHADALAAERVRHPEVDEIALLDGAPVLTVVGRDRH